MSSTQMSEVEFEDIESERADDRSAPPEYDIAVIPADYTLETIYNKWNNGDIVIPKFQRRYVWDINQASRLIESFMIGLPVPPVFLFEDQDKKCLVIDGMQRLTSIVQFFQGTFEDSHGKKHEFKLVGINKESEFYKKGFNDLEDRDVRRFKNSLLRCTLVSQRHPESEHTSIYHIFERLNTGGTSLQDQEVRNCLYAGKLNDALIELNRDPNWRRILGKPIVDSRQKDVKLILRYMALFHDGQKYHKPMKDFLSAFMAKNQDPDVSFLDDEKMRFRDTCRVIAEMLGEKPFHPNGPLNSSVFDSVFVAFAKHYKNCPQNVSDRVKQLYKNKDFQRLVGSGTTDVDTVNQRLKLAEETLFG